MRFLFITALGLLAGCSTLPLAPSSKLAGPPAWMLEKCEAVPDIPEGDGDPAVRRAHYAELRKAYSECRERQRGLRNYAVTVTR